MQKVESLGSYWFFDTANMKYMRMPKEEKPRHFPGQSPALDDLVWHDYDSYEIKSHCRWHEVNCLYIYTSVSASGRVHAPHAVMVRS